MTRGRGRRTSADRGRRAHFASGVGKGLRAASRLVPAGCGCGVGRCASCHATVLEPTTAVPLRPRPLWKRRTARYGLRALGRPHLIYV
ncbi:hypothetical protein BU14_0407s0004 [Porphyra umbilicalis]|uniref:Uncharacterized protein n=1 Tax=Porphyra umbilicalis TaxID=2786 RepID=A0A1X6NW41_PORUM|nr:hypothetical protein BU14_0407s0004 [Porphyra umbilicalis]|eukprot:OSX72740.1 hypothetical protein BU14_0407s0004 [Porphyra umbilicalis]